MAQVTLEVRKYLCLLDRITYLSRDFRHRYLLEWVSTVPTTWPTRYTWHINSHWALVMVHRGLDKLVRSLHSTASTFIRRITCVLISSERMAGEWLADERGKTNRARSQGGSRLRQDSSTYFSGKRLNSKNEAGIDNYFFLTGISFKSA